MLAGLTLTKRYLVPTFVFLIDNFRLRSREGGAPSALLAVYRNGGRAAPAEAESVGMEGSCLLPLMSHSF